MRLSFPVLESQLGDAALVQIPEAESDHHVVDIAGRGRAKDQRAAPAQVDGRARAELLQRLIGLVRVVVTDAEVGAGIDVLRIELERLLVVLDRIVVALGVEVGVAKLHVRARVLGIVLDDRVERLDNANDLIVLLQRRTENRACRVPGLAVDTREKSRVL